MWRLLRERNGRSESSVTLERENLGLERSGGIAMASMSFKLFLLLLFLLWGLKPTFLESCSRVWKWTQSFVFFFFCGFLYF